ncbi:hypothetical protein BTHERMOSOX_1613 [Bathymodiolus thermophilus thioautotrophic gill symbiont]|uniref:Uncharacterized protein n=1 Tax=Bathymodiolus thermophilus thioautotrophic gill symbiont TaxID=2360 RepID=A0A8H9CFD9_9GAMM|nr:hypothetical protein THERMOS_837 [Bathymodiolus thermophilus thioautotrophic gill symbiont]CAB5503996.1 hypothetical protein THERMOT_1889 [Bathymodiolus thermophilus thioautotrophic gill symbiont]SHA15433.1 hypothetical protein BTHERMOSOX_1613 [Bathymodiolus thermophilus thioautotrophic gill symbiont]
MNNHQDSTFYAFGDFLAQQIPLNTQNSHNIFYSKPLLLW